MKKLEGPLQKSVLDVLEKNNDLTFMEIVALIYPIRKDAIARKGNVHRALNDLVNAGLVSSTVSRSAKYKLKKK